MALVCVGGLGLMVNGSTTWALAPASPNAGTLELPASDLHTSDLNASDGQASDQHLPATPANARAPFSIRAVYQQNAKPEKTTPPPAHGVVGLNLLIQQGHYPLVHGVFPGTPAARQGIQSGDRILFINGATTLGKSVTAVDAMISNVPGEVVDFTLQRGTRMVQVHLTVAALEALSPHVRPAFSGLFGSVP